MELNCKKTISIIIYSSLRPLGSCVCVIVNIIIEWNIPSVLILFCFMNSLTKLKLGCLQLEIFSLEEESIEVAISDILAQFPLLICAWCWISKTFTCFLFNVSDWKMNEVILKKFIWKIGNDVLRPYRIFSMLHHIILQQTPNQFLLIQVWHALAFCCVFD